MVYSMTTGRRDSRIFHAVKTGSGRPVPGMTYKAVCGVRVDHHGRLGSSRVCPKCQKMTGTWSGSERSIIEKVQVDNSPTWWTQWKVDIPEGESGGYRVERFKISEDEARMGNMLGVFSFSSRGQTLYAGQYTRLVQSGEYWMSDTYDEIRGHSVPIRVTSQDSVCLVNGLGMGMVANAMLTKGACVTAIERSADVIQLVAPWLLDRFGDRFKVFCDDSLAWRPPAKAEYDVVWHDIWRAKTSDNLPAMHRLHRRYGRRCSWQGSWGRAECERLRCYETLK